MQSSGLKRNILLIALAIGVLLFIFLPDRNPAEQSYDMVMKNEFEKSNMITLNKDSVFDHLKNKYAGNIEVFDGDTIHLVIKNQGSKVSDFYNDNESMLSIKNYGFKIQKSSDNRIDAYFTRESIAGIDYILLPTDVIYGIFAN